MQTNYNRSVMLIDELYTRMWLYVHDMQTVVCQMIVVPLSVHTHSLLRMRVLSGKPDNDWERGEFII